MPPLVREALGETQPSRFNNTWLAVPSTTTGTYEGAQYVSADVAMAEV